MGALGLCTLLGLSALLAPILLRWYVDRRYRGRIYSVETVPARRVALVFGAGITRDGRPQATRPNTSPT